MRDIKLFLPCSHVSPWKPSRHLQYPSFLSQTPFFVPTLSQSNRQSEYNEENQPIYLWKVSGMGYNAKQ